MLLSDEELQKRAIRMQAALREQKERVGLLFATLALIAVRKGAMPVEQLLTTMQRRLLSKSSTALPEKDDEREGGALSARYERLVKETWRQQKYLRIALGRNASTGQTETLVLWGPRAVLEFRAPAMASWLLHNTAPSDAAGGYRLSQEKQASLRHLMSAPQCYGSVQVSLPSTL